MELSGVDCNITFLYALIFKRMKTNWIGHILRRNCFLKHVIEGNVG
jgi:hypothetical protein